MSFSTPSEKTLALLLKYEVGGGKPYYDKFLSKFTWPKGQSGPTIAIGIDCAYYTAQELVQIFSFLPQDQVALIQKAVGQYGAKGEAYTQVLRKAGITVNWDQAVEIFNKYTWPKYTKLAEKAFPGLTELHPDAYGAIVSIVFNRGTSMSGDSRKEMKNIQDLVPKKDYAAIAKEIKNMKRLWIGKGLDGLLSRRDDEAALILSAV